MVVAYEVFIEERLIAPPTFFIEPLGGAAKGPPCRGLELSAVWCYMFPVSAPRRRQNMAISSKRVQGGTGDEGIAVRPAQYCDLHTHTTASDGSDHPAELIENAGRAGLAAVAVTDHDTIDGLPAALAAGGELGIEVLPGVELSLLSPSGSMHLLGYLIAPDAPVLSEVLARVQSARSARNPLILERLGALGLPIAFQELEEMAEGGQIGRPHIARAMVKHGYVGTVGEAFARYLKKDAPAYVPKSILTPEEAIEAVHRAGGLAVLAHPISLGIQPLSGLDEMVAEWTDRGLDGIECYYTEHDPETTARCLELCRRYDLVPTGGSDYHGKAKPQVRLGRGRGSLRVPYRCVEELKERHSRLRR
jgi:predicted metal-dependent phosphoesterase TrpH